MNITNLIHKNRLHLKKNALNEKCALKKRVFQTDLRADFLERIVHEIRGFTVCFCALISQVFLLGHRIFKYTVRQVSMSAFGWSDVIIITTARGPCDSNANRSLAFIPETAVGRCMQLSCIFRIVSDSLSIQYIDKESTRQLSETPPKMCIKHVFYAQNKSICIVHEVGRCMELQIEIRYLYDTVSCTHCSVLQLSVQ